jgi:hypothetical protein
VNPHRWDGVTQRSSFGEHVVKVRDRLADAARVGEWTVVFEVLEEAPQWVNSGRVGGTRGYTPLHQAAWHGANADVVDRLLKLGAWRTLRNSSGETARDVAMRREHTHLIELMTPVICHPVSTEVLTRLESNLHGLIRERAADLVREHRLRLPELSPLTEVAEPTFWFPVPGMYGGFRYTLDGAELAVDSWCRIVGGSGETHRVTADGVRLVESGWA